MFGCGNNIPNINIFLDISVAIVASIAGFCGIMSGALGSPGFGLIVPLLMMSGLFPSFQIALGVYFMGVVLPDAVNAVVFVANNRNIMNIKLNIIFSIVFAICSGLAVHFSKYVQDKHKFYLAGVFQLFLGSWYLLNANSL